ncbi:MAG TPA: methylisocitrate lyase [Nitrospirales bacterium]|nr:methylisocitrate lyase [Nitrospirales bacterium]
MTRKTVTPESRAQRFRALLQHDTLAVPGVFNAFTARLVEDAGFSAAYLSGAGLSASRAFPDIGLLTMTEVVTETRYVTQSVQIPVIVDADTGFGERQQVYRTVQELEAAGAVGIQLEDQVLAKRCGHLPGKTLISCDVMCQKIHSAIAAKQDRDLVIIARTDARAVEGLDGAIERARAYRAAGADAIFPEALQSAKEFEAVASALEDSGSFLVANMTEWGQTPYITVKEFSGMGYHVVLFPMTVFRMMAKAGEEALLELKKHGTQESILSRMQTRQALYEVLGYEQYDLFDRRMREGTE